MAKDKSPALPDAPEFQEDPRFTQGLEQLFDLGGRLTSFDFGGELGPLQETISTSPETTQLFLKGLKAELDPIFRDIRTETINQLAANNQLESSVTANRLATVESDLQKRFITQSTQFGLADIDRALRNRIQLFGTGLETLRGATGSAQRAGEFQNQFNLANYENIIARDLFSRDENASGVEGGIQGAISGGLAGFSVGGPIGGVIGAVGGGVAGSQGIDVTGASSVLSTFPGQSASNNPFGGLRDNASNVRLPNSLDRFKNTNLALSAGLN